MRNCSAVGNAAVVRAYRDDSWLMERAGNFAPFEAQGKPTGLVVICVRTQP